MNLQTTTLASRATALATLLAYAAEVGLPAPYRANLDDSERAVELMVRNVADMAEWALALETTIETEEGEVTPGRTYVRHTVSGELLELALTVSGYEHFVTVPA